MPVSRETSSADICGNPMPDSDKFCLPFAHRLVGTVRPRRSLLLIAIIMASWLWEGARQKLAPLVMAGTRGQGADQLGFEAGWRRLPGWGMEAGVSQDPCCAQQYVQVVRPDWGKPSRSVNAEDGFRYEPPESLEGVHAGAGVSQTVLPAGPDAACFRCCTSPGNDSGSGIFPAGGPGRPNKDTESCVWFEPRRALRPGKRADL